MGVGIIGASPERGWAAVAHVPALAALPQYELRAISTSRPETAAAAREAFKVPLAFSDYRELVAHPEVELVTVSVNVTRHYEVATAAIAAGKHIYCEWPLGRNLAEAEEITRLAGEKGVRTVIGLQGRFAPAVVYLRDLVADGYVGKILGTSIRGCGPDDVWTGRLDPHFEFHADKENGATLLTIAVGHALEQLCYALGEFATVSSTLIARRGEAFRVRDNATVPMTAQDQVAIGGTLEGGGLASVYYHGGPSPHPDFTWEINGTEGSLLLSAQDGYANIAELSLQGARGADPLALLTIPDRYHCAPAGLVGPAVNVASLYSRFAQDIKDGTAFAPDFDAAVRRHRLIAAIERADATGTRQTYDADA
ncbi:MAG: Gfo/Idh/MocA family oxidoreductase [Akkermansiaceae bacterium]|nr:Gfo/Idh/MocA family oxidoreductase [Armatimonadota bacterium]